MAQGRVLHVARNRYALPTASDGLRAAARLSGVASHGTAAAVHGWELAFQPARPDVVEQADPRAANPLESVLPAIALDVPGLDVEPQVTISDRGLRGRPDLVDRRRRLVLAWEHVMHQPDYVRDVLLVLVGGTGERAALTRSLVHGG